MKKNYFLAFALLLFSTSALFAQTLTNGDFELWPPNCPYNVAPNSWTNFSTSLGPDQAGTCAGTVTPYQGSSHMNLVWSNTGLFEGCNQIVSGFTPSTAYVINFFAIHDRGLYASTGSVFLDVYVGSTVIFSTPELFNGGNWTTYSAVFTAANTSETIGFRVRDGLTGTSGSVGVDAVSVSSAMGINIIPQSDLFSFSPNPASNSIDIAFPGNFSQMNISIYDMVGQIISSTTPLSGDTHAHIDLPELSKGIYFITVEKDGNTSTKKLIIN